MWPPPAPRARPCTATTRTTVRTVDSQRTPTAHTSTPPAKSASVEPNRSHRSRARPPRSRQAPRGRSRQPGARAPGRAAAWPSAPRRRPARRPGCGHLGANRDQAEGEVRRSGSRGDAPWDEQRGEEREKNARRMAPASFTSARSGPAYSRTMASWIIVSSRWVFGLSTGKRPVSATMTITRATTANRRWGLANQAGCSSDRVTMVGRLEERAGNREGQHRHEQRRLSQCSDRHGPAGAHAGEGRPSVERPEGEGHRPQQEQEHDGEQVGGPAQGWGGREQRGDRRSHCDRGEEHQRCHPEHPARRFGPCALLTQQLA